MKKSSDNVIQGLAGELCKRVLTLGELVEVAESERLPLSKVVVAEAMGRQGNSYEEILSQVMNAFQHNLEATEVGLTWGKSFLFGTAIRELAQTEDAMIGDSFINKALLYTLATEVGNHEIGLQPCAGTGDSCPYTGLIKAMKEEGYSQEQVALETFIGVHVDQTLGADLSPSRPVEVAQ